MIASPFGLLTPSLGFALLATVQVYAFLVTCMEAPMPAANSAMESCVKDILDLTPMAR